MSESFIKPVSRREFLANILATGGVLGLQSGIVLAATPIDDFWWRHITPFAQIEDTNTFLQTMARMDIFGFGTDPTWGPFAQRLTELDSINNFRFLKNHGTRIIAYIEGFGDCMLYAARLNRSQDGSFQKRTDDPSLPSLIRNAWDWGNDTLPEGNVTRWIGVQNTVNDEDFIPPAYKREACQLPIPRYPDGRSAVGWIDGKRYPLNARIFDACGSKDVNGNLRPTFESPSGLSQTINNAAQKSWRILDIYPAIYGVDDTSTPGLKAGDTVYSCIISVHKDLSAPFWREYVRLSIREIIKHGADGVWCDNFSPWDNFGYPPVEKAFGDWSLHRFAQYQIQKHGANSSNTAMPENDIQDVRTYLKSKAVGFGAKDPSKYDDPAWRDERWLMDTTWCAFKACRQKWGRQDLQEFYHAIHDEANKAGLQDFCIGGNDIPLYGLGWVRNDWLDMVNTEVTPGWHMGTGSRGIMLPPDGRMAVVYRAALEHQKGPYCGAWYYLDGVYQKYQGKQGISRVLMAEAYANGAFLLCDPNQKKVAGTVETHAWWNRFLLANANHFDKRFPVADIGILFSPDNQLGQLAPGGFPDMDHQPHIFGHWGWAAAMIDGHLPYRAITDWNLNERALKGMRTLIIPNANWLDDQIGDTIGKWVRAGGRLVVTGPMGTHYGPERDFTPRRFSLLSRLIGTKTTDEHKSAVEKQLGNGYVHWIPDPTGMNYYLKVDNRRPLLPQMKNAAGASNLLEADNLPAALGVFLWKSHDDGALFADLVNYDIDLDTDQIQPVTDITFKVRLPRTWKSAKVMTLSPDTGTQASIKLYAGAAEVHIPRLTHYASVKLIKE
jgi:hypothetical protein